MATWRSKDNAAALYVNMMPARLKMTTIAMITMRKMVVSMMMIMMAMMIQVTVIIMTMMPPGLKPFA